MQDYLERYGNAILLLMGSRVCRGRHVAVPMSGSAVDGLRVREVFARRLPGNRRFEVKPERGYSGER